MSTAQRPAHPGNPRHNWQKTLRQWHWISSALCLLAMLLFSLTGITLNHAGQIEAKPQVLRLSAPLPIALQSRLKTLAVSQDGHKGPLPGEAAQWLRAIWGIDATQQVAEWAPDELLLTLPRPGGDAWVRLALDKGQAEYEVTDRGWISWLNDLHKGRHAGAVWFWFMDLFALACLVFCITGFMILQRHASQRALTWPMVGLGVLAPVLIALLFIH